MKAQLYTLKPKSIVAFQWLPYDDGFKFPDWFVHLYEKGRANYIKDGEKSLINLHNKRGHYVGLVGDWVCKDEYGHIFIVSQKTFHERYV